MQCVVIYDVCYCKGLHIGREEKKNHFMGELANKIILSTKCCTPGMSATRLNVAFFFVTKPLVASRHNSIFGLKFCPIILEVESWNFGFCIYNLVASGIFNMRALKMLNTNVYNTMNSFRIQRSNQFWVQRLNSNKKFLWRYLSIVWCFVASEI